MLKAKKPEQCKKRLKLFMFGDAGVGKTTAALALPKPYIIDAERGTENYHDAINKVGGAVWQTVDMQEVIDEVRMLSSEEHDFKTLVIDPISPLWFDLLEKCEAEVGSEYGRNFAEAGKYMKRLVSLLMKLDMNVVMTSHAKPVYGDDMKVEGLTFDAWKRLPYIFDLVLELRRQTPTTRYARVVKTRIDSFPDGETFPWGFDEISKRYDLGVDRHAEIVEFASKTLCEDVTIAARETGKHDFVQKCLKAAGVEALEDLTKKQAEAMLGKMKGNVNV